MIYENDIICQNSGGSHERTPQDTKRCLLLELDTYFLFKDDSQFLNQPRLKNINLNLILTRNIATEQAL